jgi:hypothetical protein
VRITGEGINLDSYTVVIHELEVDPTTNQPLNWLMRKFLGWFFPKKVKRVQSNVTDEEESYYGTPKRLRRVDNEVFLKLLEEATKIDFAH